MKVAISFLSKDRVELSKQSIKPLLNGAEQNQYHLWWIDGSTTAEGEELPNLPSARGGGYPTVMTRSNIRGGAGAAIVYALTELLNHPERYDYIGLVENDVLLPEGWFEPTMALFEKGEQDGLHVGAVSARAYEDRVLFQRDGYAVMHNLGAGMIVLTRAAARIVLNTFRTAWSADNRRLWAQLAGVDIGTFWAFRFNEHYLTADWHWEVALARYGLASLALTPSSVEMIGQDPPLAEQGLVIVKEPVVLRTDHSRFEQFRLNMSYGPQTSVETTFHFDPRTGTWTYFPHQLHILGAEYTGDWRLKEARGWGTFAWQAGNDFAKTPPSVWLSLTGPCAILVGGGKAGGKVDIKSLTTGFSATPELQSDENGQIMQVQVPGGLVPQQIVVTALTPGVTFYGLQTREKQPYYLRPFEHSMLPTP